VDLPPATRDALAATEAERARAVWSRRFGAPSTDPRERARQARFLLARGFDAETVRRLVAAGSPGDPGDSGDPGDEA
jgi:regulatory protein